jgi:PAS domain S-box-containing protein
MPSRLANFLPNSLVSRVYALYCATMLIFVICGLSLFFYYQLTVVLEEQQVSSDSLMNIVGPVIADNAVIGDYDSIQGTLNRMVGHSRLLSASFIDKRGGVVRALAAQESYPSPKGWHPPEWLTHVVQRKLYDTNQLVNVGGVDYGVLRLSLNAQLIANDLWIQIRLALLLAAAAILGGLVLVRYPLVRWLGKLQGLQAFEQAMDQGVASPELLRSEQAPSELRATFEVLGRAATILQSQRNQAAVTLASIGDGVIALDPAGHITLANPAACDMLGMTQTELIRRSISRLLPQVIPSSDMLHPWKGRRITIRNKLGQELVVDTTLSVIESPSGEVTGYVLACRDMSEQHELDLRLSAELKSRATALVSLRNLLEGLTRDDQNAEEINQRGHDDLDAITSMISLLVYRLQIRGEQLNAIFDLSPDGFVSFDSQRRANYLSPAFTELTGLKAQQVLGSEESAVETLLRGLCRAGSTWRSFEAIRSGLVPGEEGHAERREVIELERPRKRVLSLRLRAGSSHLISQVLSLRDVTHETEVDQMKSEFLSTAAHELRTPMTSIYGFIELLKIRRNMPPERQAELINTVHRQSELMISIINELLDLARIEARRGKDFELELIDLVSLSHDLTRDFKPPAERPSPLMICEVSQALVLIDKNKMAQAIGNVLSNAYKYSPAGGEVRVRILQDEHDGQSAYGFEITDHGIGMTPEQVTRVFERFYRADTSGAIPGTGLGMSIVKEIIELQGGRMAVQSEYGVGTTVTLWLPRARAS